MVGARSVCTPADFTNRLAPTDRLRRPSAMRRSEKIIMSGARPGRWGKTVSEAVGRRVVRRAVDVAERDGAAAPTHGNAPA
eukprot:scaffold53666_cov75-Phaeocystis_antarctica.AAC.2